MSSNGEQRVTNEGRASALVAVAGSLHRRRASSKDIADAPVGAPAPVAVPQAEKPTSSPTVRPMPAVDDDALPESDSSDSAQTPALPSGDVLGALVVGPERRSMLGDILKTVKARDAVRLFAVWSLRLTTDARQGPFLIVAGDLANPEGWIYGGIAETWNEALQLHGVVTYRLDDLAARSARRLTSEWLLCVGPERRAAIRRDAAMRLPAGHA